MPARCIRRAPETRTKKRPVIAAERKILRPDDGLGRLVPVRKCSSTERKFESAADGLQRCFLPFSCLDDDWIVPAPVELLIRLGMRNHVGYTWIRLVRGTGKQFLIFGARFGCEEISGGDKEVWKLASVAVVEVVMQQGGFGTLFGFEFDENLCVFCFDFLFFTWFRL